MRVAHPAPRSPSYLPNKIPREGPVVVLDIEGAMERSSRRPTGRISDPDEAGHVTRLSRTRDEGELIPFTLTERYPFPKTVTFHRDGLRKIVQEDDLLLRHIEAKQHRILVPDDASRLLPEGRAARADEQRGEDNEQSEKVRHLSLQ